MPHAHHSNFMPPRQLALLEPSLWGKEMTRRLLNHDVLSDLFVESWDLYIRKQFNFRKTELSKDGTSLTPRGFSQTLIKYTFSQVSFPLLRRNGNQLHSNRFSVNWRPGTTRVRKKCQYRMPPFPLPGHLTGQLRKVVGMRVTCPYAQKLETI